MILEKMEVTQSNNIECIFLRLHYYLLIVNVVNTSKYLKFKIMIVRLGASQSQFCLSWTSSESNKKSSKSKTFLLLLSASTSVPKNEINCFILFYLLTLFLLIFV